MAATRPVLCKAVAPTSKQPLPQEAIEKAITTVTGFCTTASSTRHRLRKGQYPTCQTWDPGTILTIYTYSQTNLKGDKL